METLTFATVQGIGNFFHDVAQALKDSQIVASDKRGYEVVGRYATTVTHFYTMGLTGHEAAQRLMEQAQFNL